MTAPRVTGSFGAQRLRMTFARTARTSLLEQRVEGRPRVVGRGDAAAAGQVERLRGREERALVLRLLRDDARGDGLRALEARRCVEVRALAARVQRRAALAADGVDADRVE